MNQAKESFISKPLLLLTAAHAATDLSQGALPAMLPALKSTLHLSYAQVGIIVLMQNLTSSVIQPIFGYLSDKVSLPWLIPVSVAISGIGMASTGFMPSYVTLLLSVIISGLGIAAFHPQSSRAANLVSSGKSKGRSIGAFSVGGNLGGALGSIFITYLLTLPGGLSNTLFFCLPAAVIAFLVWRNLSQVSPPPVAVAAAATHTSVVSNVKLPWGMLVILLSFIFIRSSIHTGLSTYIPLYYIDNLAGSPIYAGYLLSAFLVAGVIGTYIGGILSDRLGRKTVILFSMIASMPLIFLFQFTSGVFSVIFTALTGLVLVSSFATTVVLSHEMMPGHLGMASGLTIGFSIGLGGVGATILGYIADHFGVPAIFTLLTFLPVVGVAFAIFLPGKLGKRDVPLHA